MQQDLFSAVEVIEPMSQAEARQCVDDIKNGIVNVGRRLLDLYERNGWEALGYSSWRECAQVEFNFKQAYVYKLLAAAEIERNLAETDFYTNGIKPESERQIRPLAPLPPDLQREAWRAAVDTAPNGKVTAAHVQAVVDAMTQPKAARHCPYCGNSYNAFVPDHGVTTCPFCNQSHSYSGPRDTEKYGPYRQPEPEKQRAQQAMGATVYSHNSLDYYTPRYVTDAAREVMGGIDLDPASCDMAQAWIGAGQYFTIADNGLSQPWGGRVWLNPPYSYTDGRSNQDLWSERLVTEYLQGNVVEGVLLVKAALGYKWFERLWDQWPVCFMRDRLSFVLPDGTDDGQSKQATAIFYIGGNVAKFVDVFRKFGRVILPEDQKYG